MCDIPAKTAIGDSLHDTVPLNFLMVIQFVATWNSAGVEVGDPLDVVSDSTDEVPFHDLHVVDVIQQLHIG